MQEWNKENSGWLARLSAQCVKGVIHKRVLLCNEVITLEESVESDGLLPLFLHLGFNITGIPEGFSLRLKRSALMEAIPFIESNEVFEKCEKALTEAHKWLESQPETFHVDGFYDDWFKLVKNGSYPMLSGELTIAVSTGTPESIERMLQGKPSGSVIEINEALFKELELEAIEICSKIGLCLNSMNTEHLPTLLCLEGMAGVDPDFRVSYGWGEDERVYLPQCATWIMRDFKEAMEKGARELLKREEMPEIAAIKARASIKGGLYTVTMSKAELADWIPSVSMDEVKFAQLEACRLGKGEVLKVILKWKKPNVKKSGLTRQLDGLSRDAALKSGNPKCIRLTWGDVALKDLRKAMRRYFFLDEATLVVLKEIFRAKTEMRDLSATEMDERMSLGTGMTEVARAALSLFKTKSFEIWGCQISVMDVITEDGFLPVLLYMAFDITGVPQGYFLKKTMSADCGGVGMVLNDVTMIECVKALNILCERLNDDGHIILDGEFETWLEWANDFGRVWDNQVALAVKSENEVKLRSLMEKGVGISDVAPLHDDLQNDLVSNAIHIFRGSIIVNDGVPRVLTRKDLFEILPMLMLKGYVDLPKGVRLKSDPLGLLFYNGPYEDECVETLERAQMILGPIIDMKELTSYWNESVKLVGGLETSRQIWEQEVRRVTILEFQQELRDSLMEGKVNVSKMILRVMGDLDLPKKTKNRLSRTALDAAIKGGDLECVNLMALRFGDSILEKALRSAKKRGLRTEALNQIVLSRKERKAFKKLTSGKGEIKGKGRRRI